MVKITALVTILNEERYIELSIKSISPFVDKIVVFDNFSDDQTIKRINCLPEDIKSNMVLYQSNKRLHRHQALQEAKNLVDTEFVLFWDGDWIAYGDEDEISIREIIDKVKTSHLDLDGIQIKVLNLAGDLHHMKKNSNFKIYNNWLIKKEFINFSSNSNYYLVYETNPKGRYSNFAKPSDPHYACNLTWTKPTEKLFYQCYANNYYKYCIENDKDYLSFTIKQYIETVLGKNYAGSVKWTQNNIKNYIEKHDYKLPLILEDLKKSPHFLVKYIGDDVVREKILQGNAIHDYQITLIVLVRNSEQYLRDCLKSVFKQTNDNWKIVIVNDGSDNGPINLDDYLDPVEFKYKDKIKLFNSDKWLGLIKCHKIGVLNAETDIVGILDSDDMLEPETVDEILKVYNYSEDENIFVYSNFWYCDENMNKVRPGFSAKVNTSLLNDRTGLHFRTFKLKHYYLTNGYDDDLCFGAEDQDILFQLEEFARPIYLDKYLYLYRRFEKSNSLFTTMKTQGVYSLVLSVLKNIKMRYNDYNFKLKIESTLNDNTKLSYRNARSYHARKDCIANINGINYFFEIHGGDEMPNIFILTLLYCNNKERLGRYIEKYLESDGSENMFSVQIEYSPLIKDWLLTDGLKLFNYETHRKIHPSNYFNNVYVLNLKKDVVKRNRMIRILNNLGIKHEIFDAVNGKDHLDDFYKYCNVEGYKTPGAYGYTLTMINIFKDAMAKGYRKILTFDDDIVFHKNFLNLFDENIRQIPYDWEVLFFGFTGPWTHPFVNKDFEKFNYQKPCINDMFNCDGSHAMGYDLKVMQKIIDIVTTFKFPFDTQMVREYLIDNKKKTYSFFPHLVIADTTASDITKREIVTRKNYLDYHFKYRINMNNYDLESLYHKKYLRLKRTYNPKVSIIVPVYNKEPYIRACILSLINQTYQNMEIIIVEDRSTDRSWEILQEFKDYPKVRLYQNETNLKCYRNRNKGLALATGDIIGFQDGDDYSLSTRIEKQVKFMFDHDLLVSSCEMLRSHIEVIDHDKDQVIINKAMELRIHKTDGQYDTCCRIHFEYITFLFDRLIFEKIGTYLEYPKGMDMEFPERILYYTTKKVFAKGENSWTFFDNESTSFYKKLPELLYFSPQMNELNLTNQVVYEEGQFEKIKELWRSYYEIRDGDIYPRSDVYPKLGDALKNECEKDKINNCNDSTESIESTESTESIENEKENEKSE